MAAGQLVPSSVPVIRELLTKNIDSLRGALPKHVTPERIIRVVVNSLSRNPQLQECTQLSLIGSVLQSAFLGLEPDGREACIIPRKNNKTGQMEANFQAMTWGLLKLSRNSGMLKIAYSILVKEKDHFEYEEGLDRKLIHKPSQEADRGKIIGAYSVFQLDTGEKDFEYMSIKQLLEIRSRSKAINSGPWVTDEEEMFRKIPLIRLLKRAPRSAELRDALDQDAAADAGTPMNFKDVFEQVGMPIPNEKRTRVEMPAAGAQEGEFTETGTGTADPSKTDKSIGDPSEGSGAAASSTFADLAPLHRFNALSTQAKNRHGKEAMEAALKRAGVLGQFPSKMKPEQLQTGIDELLLMENAAGT